MHRFFPVSLLISIFLWAFGVGLCLAKPTPLPGASDVLVDRDQQYVAGDNPGQRLDLYQPATPPTRPMPLIIWLHGGGWMAGSKSYCPGPAIVRAGFVVASVEYRFSTTAKFPAQIQDCQAAVRWLRAHHEDLGFDPNQIGVMGESAGGHLAALLGLTGDKHTYEAIGENTTTSDRVQAVCDCYGPADFATYRAQAEADRTVTNVLGLEGATNLYRTLTGKAVGEDHATDVAASPISFVDSHAPPFLILHGSKDNIVPVAQSVELADALKKAGDDVVLQIVAGAGHGGMRFFDPRALTLVRAFFEKHLKGMNVRVETNVELSGGR